MSGLANLENISQNISQILLLNLKTWGYLNNYIHISLRNKNEKLNFWITGFEQQYKLKKYL